MSMSKWETLVTDDSEFVFLCESTKQLNAAARNLPKCMRDFDRIQEMADSFSELTIQVRAERIKRAASEDRS